MSNGVQNIFDSLAESYYNVGKKGFKDKEIKYGDAEVF